MIPARPIIVCLCGSTKFKDEFTRVNFEQTMEGKIVLTVGWFGHADADVYSPTVSEKLFLDELHKRKIDLCDEVFVVNVGGYIGESTRSEIEHAVAIGRPVRYLSKEKAGRRMTFDPGDRIVKRALKNAIGRGLVVPPPSSRHSRLPFVLIVAAVVVVVWFALLVLGCLQRINNGDL